MTKAFTREEFHALVWSRPMTQLAKEFGLSDVALHKSCRKHAIPTPPAGWWAKQKAGKKVSVTPLRAAPPDDDGKVLIAARQPGVLAGERAKARDRAAGDQGGHSPDECEIVSATLAVLRRSHASHMGLVTCARDGLIRCEIAPASIDRLGRILGQVTSAACIQDFNLVSPDKGPARFTNGMDDVGFSLSETFQRLKHQPTASELAAEAKWDRMLERRRNGWFDIDWSKRPVTPEWDWRPTGKLSLELDHVWVAGEPSPRRTFNDAKVQRLEVIATEVAIGVAVIAAAKRQQRLQRENREKAAEEARRQREIAQRTEYIEQRRGAALTSILRELEEIEKLKELLPKFCEPDGEHAHPRVVEFDRWVSRRLADLESAITAENLERRFDRSKLFGSDDDHDFVFRAVQGRDAPPIYRHDFDRRPTG
ncbi:hypothetical protein [Blastomonas marina]|nr:hypothetical protein [Blastomonas marina]